MQGQRAEIYGMSGLVLLVTIGFQAFTALVLRHFCPAFFLNGTHGSPYLAFMFRPCRLFPSRQTES
jgi:hypothetical protein